MNSKHSLPHIHPMFNDVDSVQTLSFLFFSIPFSFFNQDHIIISVSIHKQHRSTRNMILCHINHSNLVFSYILLILISSSIASRRQSSLTIKLKSAEYKRLAKYCLIQDYSAWLQRQQQLKLWFDLAKLLGLSIHEDVEFQRELERYRLQYECLRLFERLPVSFGPG